MKLFFFFVITISVLSCGQAPQPYEQTGEASYYANSLNGNVTADGGHYDKTKLTAAHNHLPLGTIIEVTNMSNDKMVTVEINDRGPYSSGRILDLSRAAAKQLEMVEDGTTKIHLKVMQPAPGYTVADSVESEK